MNRLSRIFRSLGFRVALLTLVILALGMGLLWSSRTRRTAQPPPARRATAANPTQHTLPTKTVTQGYNRPIDHFTAPPPPPAGGSSSGPPPLSESVRKTLVGEPGPISLFPNAAAPPPAPPAALPPTRYLPSFRLIRCMLITAPQTGEIETPLIGVVLENQYNIDADGRSQLVIPAGIDRVTKMLDDIRTQIEQKGYYVAVLPGKEFYLYNKVPIDLRLARRPGPLSAGSTPTSAAALLPAGLPGLPEPKT